MTRAGWRVQVLCSHGLGRQREQQRPKRRGGEPDQADSDAAAKAKAELPTKSVKIQKMITAVNSLYGPRLHPA